MEDKPDSLDNENTVQAGLPNETFRLRSYQAEMVEASLQENIIVAMDTGSGKTHIALARTEAALETSEPDKFVWFLAPTKALCHQQHGVFCSHLPAFGIRFLTGDDNVDRWTDQRTWDDVLKNIRIVISTHAVLLDALTHGFVKFKRLALLIYDEAHHCRGNHPARQIMQKFYLPLKVSSPPSSSLPRILGLSASPVINTNPDELDTIEKNLDSITKTPKIHRSELIRFVHKPELSTISYHAFDQKETGRPKALERLLEIRNALDIMRDPYVLQLIEQRDDGDPEAGRRLQMTLMKRNTYCQKQINGIVVKTVEMFDELGPWATDWLLRQCKTRLEKLMDSEQLQICLGNTEKQYIHAVIQRSLQGSEAIPTPVRMPHCTPKVHALINILLAESSPGFKGIIFAEQRATVVVLAQLLSVHDQTKDAFRLGTFVGTSVNSNRKMSIVDLAEPRQQQQVLDDFRDGRKNLIIATSVLEEGIDISSCHLVINFDPPKNLKSFVQRRGRARKEKSKYIILKPPTSPAKSSADLWESLEEDMKAAYMNDLREAKAAEERELIEENSALSVRVPGTDAVLDLSNASQHLHHFCAVIQSDSSVDTRPEFSFEKDSLGMVKAHVTLPVTVDASVRCSSSSSSWMTEKNAKRDACFQACKALHSAGLINDHLLPLKHQGDEDKSRFHIPDNIPSMVPVKPMLHPWVLVPQVRESGPTTFYRTLVCLSCPGEEILRVVMLTTSPLPQIPEVILYWNRTKQYTITTQVDQVVQCSESEIHFMKDFTFRLLHSIFGARMPDGQRDFVALFVAFDEETFSTAQQINWVSMPSGNDSAVEALSFFSEHRREDAGLIQLRGDARKFILHDIQPGDGPAGPQLVVSPFPKRRDFLHRMNQQDQSNEAFSSIRNLEAKDCLVHRLPTALSLFALFVPPLLHRHEVYMLAEHLRTTILAPVSIESTHLGTLVQALTASSANEDEDYQRLEFFGDCILKFFTSINLMASNLNWPEGYLTAKKGRITSNGFLARATMALGLERFIITKPFTGAKWKPRYERDVRSDEAQNADEEVFRSSKLIADVIESLIGASWVIGGLPKALLCLRTLLSTEDWKPVAESQEVLYEATPEEPSPQHLAVVESIVGYTFTKKHLMLEALTHASFKGPREVASSSYQRLEFLGDAILDYIVVKRLFAETPSLPFAKMHTVRTAMVNAAFLAFLSFENTVPEEQISIVFDPIRNECIPAEPVIVHRVLWQFLRQSPPGPKTQAASLERHRTYREQIIRALNEEARYPWHLLARTDAEKVFSDMVESMIGAIYIDSHGDLAACEGYIKKLGIMDCLERILRDGVDCLHPKEKLGHLAVSDSVEYTIVKVKDAGEHFCQVKVGGREIGGVVGGMRRLNAETEAAWEAVKIIETEQDSIMQVSDVDGGVALQETDGSDSEYEDANEEMEDD